MPETMTRTVVAPVDDIEHYRNVVSIKLQTHPAVNGDEIKMNAFGSLELTFKDGGSQHIDFDFIDGVSIAHVVVAGGK